MVLTFDETLCAGFGIVVKVVSTSDGVDGDLLLHMRKMAIPLASFKALNNSAYKPGLSGPLTSISEDFRPGFGGRSSRRGFSDCENMI
jgi:hypothetical protein